MLRSSAPVNPHYSRDSRANDCSSHPQQDGGTQVQILLVDGDAEVRQATASHLRLMKFLVMETGNRGEAFRLLERHDFDLVIMELGCNANAASPAETASCELSGFEILEILRSAATYVPAIATSSVTSPVFELAAIRTGADVFLAKPVDLNLLTAHVRAKLKLRQAFRAVGVGRVTSPSRQQSAGQVIQSGDLLIDTKHRLVSVQNGEYRSLTAVELKLLTAMASNPGRVFRKHELLEEIWGVDAECGYGAVESLVKRLRKKIEPTNGTRKYILSSRGLGYRLVA